MKTHDHMINALMSRPGVKAEVERIEREEGELLDSLLRARREAGLSPRTQACHPGRRLVTHDADLSPRTRSGVHLWFFAGLLKAWIPGQARDDKNGHGSRVRPGMTKTGMDPGSGPG